MPVANYKMLFEQDVKGVITLESFALSVFALIEAADEVAADSPYSYRVRLEALYAIKRACEEILEAQTVELADEPQTPVIGEVDSVNRRLVT